MTALKSKSSANLHLAVDNVKSDAAQIVLVNTIGGTMFMRKADLPPSYVDHGFGYELSDRAAVERYVMNYPATSIERIKRYTIRNWLNIFAYSMLAAEATTLGLLALWGK